MVTPKPLRNDMAMKIDNCVQSNPHPQKRRMDAAKPTRGKKTAMKFTSWNVAETRCARSGGGEV
jgi:hypothetical protein